MSVPKGVSGGDVIQTVSSQAGTCGTILWEAKRTKAWSDSWISKLKQDQRTINADIAVIVTKALPKDMQGSITVINGIWVVDFANLVGLAMALRGSLIQLSTAKASI